MFNNNSNLFRHNQYLVHCLSCQAVRCMAYVHFCSGPMLKRLGLDLGTYGLGLEGRSSTSWWVTYVAMWSTS